jgi:hypothetical protein
MVHCLEVLNRLNAEAAKQRKGRKGAEAPEQVSLKPAALRDFLNRPWTRRELQGDQDVYKTYAKSSAEPFLKQEGQREGLRT